MPDSDTSTTSVIVNREARSWGPWFAAALVAGLWMVPIIWFGAQPSAGRDAVMMTIALAGAVSSAIGFFIGLVAGIRLRRS